MKKYFPTLSPFGKKAIRKVIGLSLCFILIAGMAMGCKSSRADSDSVKGSASAGLTKVTLNEVAHSIFYAPMYVAMEEGYFEEEGIDLTLVTGFGVI